MEFLYVPFSLLMKGCLFISNNHYIFALFFFALFMQIILLPFAIKQQKSQIKMAEVRPKEMAIREKYKGRNDKATQQKMTMEIQEMYQQNGYNQFAGCLPLLIQLPIILILFAIVRQPMSYATDLKKDGFDINKNSENAVVFYQDVKESLNKDSEDYGKYFELLEEYQTQLGVNSVNKDKDNIPENAKTFKVNDTEVFASADRGTYKEMALSRLISYGEEDLKKLKESGIIKEDKYDEIVKKYGELGYTQEIKDKLPEYRIGPVNLIEQPSLKRDYWLLIVPILVFLTSFLSTKLTRKFSASAQQTDANGNPIGGGLFMEVGMPLISAMFSFSFSAAVGCYWIWRTLVSMLQTVILAKAMPVPVVTEEQIAEARRELKATQKTKKKKVITIEVDEDDDSYNDMIVKNHGKSANKSVDPTKRTPRNIEMLTADEEDETPANGNEE